MSNSTQDFTDRLYSRVPGYYRALDKDQGYPLLALLRVVGAQASNLRQDLDILWDNFFIETCEEWVVPYIGALVGTRLLQSPVGQSDRLDVRNTVLWRRSKGTPAMLQSLGSAITEWPTGLAEFFQSLGCSQNMNHLRMNDPLTPNIRSQYRLSLLGKVEDPFAHAADFKPARALDQALITATSLGIGRAAWGTPGRYQIKTAGFFERRLQAFPVLGATPASAVPGDTAPAGSTLFTFDPLFRNIPLFTATDAEPITRAAFENAPWNYFGSDISVKSQGIAVATGEMPQPALSNSSTPFNFGNAGAGLKLNATAGMRLIDPRQFQANGAHFTIAAEWISGGSLLTLGALSTMEALRNPGAGFHAGSTIAAAGFLAIRIALGFPGLSPVATGRFPGAVIAVRADRAGAMRTSDAIYIYLPECLLDSTGSAQLFVAGDGSTYTDPTLAPGKLARRAEGQIYPAQVSAPSTTTNSSFAKLSRLDFGMRFADISRFGGLGVVVRADVCTGIFQPLGAIATIAQAGATLPGIPVPNPWPAATYIPSTAAKNDNLPANGILSINTAPLTGNFVPAMELILTDRSGASLLVYLPELSGIPATGQNLFVADDGSTYFAPADQPSRIKVVQEGSLRSVPLARAAQGQVLPIPGTWPIEQRRPVAMDLCRFERASLLMPGELGVDPERGTFAFAASDPAMAGPLTVDYVEAFGDRIGAMNFDRQLTAAATRTVSSLGDAPKFRTLEAAIAASTDGDIIEIADSATYTPAAAIALSKAAVHRLTIRAAVGTRPCLSVSKALPASIDVTVPMDRLELNGLLIAGAPVRLSAAVKQFAAQACTILPAAAAFSALDTNPDANGQCLFCRCVVGALIFNAGTSRMTIADSIVDASLAIFSLAGQLQLERTTVLGRIQCEVLSASESLLDEIAVANERQAGCIRFCRYEPGSLLPRRFECVPSEDQIRAALLPRVTVPVFGSRRQGRPDYAQLVAGSAPEIQTASESGAEVGAFASRLNTVRASNLKIKLREFLPAGLTAVLIAET